jgi:hypothetical protein
MKNFNCNECSTPVAVNKETKTNYCDLCRPHMNESNKETPIKTLQERIQAAYQNVIKESNEELRSFKAVILQSLVEESKMFNTDADVNNYGVTSSFGLVMNSAEFYSDFTYTDDSTGDSSVEGASADTIKFLEDEKNRIAHAEKKEKAKAKAIISTYKQSGIVVDGEVENLFASQLACVKANPNAMNAGKNDGVVHVALQRLSNKGHWYKTNKESISFELEYLFVTNDKGQPVTSRVLNGSSMAYSLMHDKGFRTVNTYGYMDKQTGEWTSVVQDQRIVLSSDAFNAGVIIDGSRLEASVAPTWYSFNKDTNEVESKATFHGDDNLVEIGESVFIRPTDRDESHGQASESDYKAGILYGTSVATRAMMSEDMAKEAVNNNAKEARILQAISDKEKITKVAKVNYTAMDDAELLATHLGALIAEISEDSYKAESSAVLQLQINNKLKPYAPEARRLMMVAAAFRRKHGKALATGTWKLVTSMARAYENAEATKEVLCNVAQETLDLIDQINKGEWDISTLTEDDIVTVRETTLKFWKTSPLCRIKDAKVSNQIKGRYEYFKSFKTA